MVEDTYSSMQRGTPHRQEIKRMLASREEFLKKKRKKNKKNPLSLQTREPGDVTSGDD